LKEKISSYKLPTMRRKPGQLLDLEVAILSVMVDAERTPAPEVHGFALAQRLADRSGSRRLTGHGTLYKALGRLETAGLLESRWEDPERAEAEGRPRRRLYRITAEGGAALARAHATRDAGGRAADWRVQPS
jgi:PadR family transcriptional regulator, regulatory protein PadR